MLLLTRTGLGFHGSPDASTVATFAPAHAAFSRLFRGQIGVWHFDRSGLIITAPKTRTVDGVRVYRVRDGNALRRCNELRALTMKPRGLPHLGECRCPSDPSESAPVPTPDTHLLSRHCCVSAAIGNSTILSSKYDISAPTGSDILRYVRVEAVHFVGTYVPDRGTCRHVSWVIGDLHLIRSRSGCDASSRYCGKYNNDADPRHLVHFGFMLAC